MADAPDTSYWTEVLGGLAVLGALVAAVGKRAKRLVMGDPPDYEAMARAFFAEKEAADLGHRDAIIQALDRVAEVVRQVNETTTQNIRIVLMEYGKDVTQIKSAQDSMHRAVHDLAQKVEALHLEVARK